MTKSNNNRNGASMSVASTEPRTRLVIRTVTALPGVGAEKDAVAEVEAHIGEVLDLDPPELA